MKSSYCFKCSSVFGCVSVLDFGHSNRSVAVILTGNVIFISNALMIYKYLFIYFSDICISSLMKCLLRFVLILNVYLLLNSKNSLCILENRYLLQTFPPSMACILILLIFPHLKIHFKDLSFGIPAVVQWVKNPTAAAQFAQNWEAQVWSPVLCTGSKDLMFPQPQLKFNPWPSYFRMPCAAI